MPLNETTEIIISIIHAAAAEKLFHVHNGNPCRVFCAPIPQIYGGFRFASQRVKAGILCVFDCVLPCTVHHPCCVSGPSENRHNPCSSVQCSAGQHPRASGNEKKPGGDVKGDAYFL